MDKGAFLIKFLEALASGNIEELKKIREEVRIEIDIEIDETPKEIGDEVELINTHTLNYFIDVETDKQLSNNVQTINDAIIELYCSKKMIVIKTNIEKVYNCGHCDNPHYHDMIVYVPAVNREYYAKSEDFRVTVKE